MQYLHVNDTDWIYAVIRSIALKIWNVTGSTWETWAVAAARGNLEVNDIGKAQPTGHLWSGDFDGSIANGYYIIQYRVMPTAGTPDETDGSLIAVKGYWNGTTFLPQNITVGKTGYSLASDGLNGINLTGDTGDIKTLVDNVASNKVIVDKIGFTGSTGAYLVNADAAGNITAIAKAVVTQSITGPTGVTATNSLAARLDIPDYVLDKTTDANQWRIHTKHSVTGDIISTKLLKDAAGNPINTSTQIIGQQVEV